MQTISNTEYARALTTENAAIYCGVSAALLRRGRSAEGSKFNVPKHTTIGKRVVYLRDDLDKWLDKCRSETSNIRGSEL